MRGRSLTLSALQMSHSLQKGEGRFGKSRSRVRLCFACFNQPLGLQYLEELKNEGLLRGIDCKAGADELALAT